jgi:tetratricopeptide (TPR) repeat protein
LFDRKVSDIFSVQDEISVKVVRALNLTLDSAEELQLEGGGTNNLDAYLEVLEGRNLMTVGTPGDVRAAIDHFRRAMRLDPNYSAAYSGAAMAMVVSANFGEEHLTDAQTKSLEAEIRRINAKALELDPRNAVGYMVLLYLEGDTKKSDIYLKRILALEPNSARAHAMFAAEETAHVGAETSPTLFDEKIFHAKKALEIDPLNPMYPALLASEYFYHRTVEVERVEPLLQRSLELDANFPLARELLAMLRMCNQRRFAEGIKIMEQMVADAPSSTYYRDMLSTAYAGMGDFAAAEDVAADSKYKSSLVIALAARHRWREASMTFANSDEVFEDVFSLAGYMNALRLEAHESGSYAKARNYFERFADIKWDRDGAPALGIPMTAFPLSREIALADILQSSGEASRATKILEASLDALQTAAVKFKRGDFWLRFPRVQALTLLGRDSEALETLAQIDPGAAIYNDWRQFAVDPIFDRIRHAPRFVAFLEASERYDAEQRALVQKMRDNGEIPKRPIHEKP